MHVMVSQIESRTTNMKYDFYASGILRPQGFVNFQSMEKRFGEGMMTEHWAFSPYTVWLNPSDKPHCLAVAYDVPFKETTYNRLKNMAE